MTSINPINVNTQGIGAKVGFDSQPKKEKELETKQETVAKEQKSVSADKVLDYLSASSASVVPKKSVDPAKYVDEASAARIAAFMGQFEDKVAEGLASFETEFPGAKISDGAKMAVVLRQINQEA